MRIVERPFTGLAPADPPRPWLPIIVANPVSKLRVRAYGLIDTGADECALPAYFAAMLGLKLETGKRREISTGNGTTTAYAHKVRIELPGSEFCTEPVLIDFMPNLEIPLLGVRSFLSNFVLSVDYPKLRFTLRKT